MAQFASLVPSDEWSEGRADSYYEIGIGKTPPRKEPEWFSDTKGGNHVWLSIRDMGEPGAYSLDSSEYLTDDAVRTKNVRRVAAGSVLLSFKLTVGRVKIAGCDMTTNEAIACFASEDKRRLAYAYPFLLSFDYSKLGSTSSIATAINSKTIKAMPFAMPSDSELDSFYALTEPIYRQLLMNANESGALAALRDALLPKLMSGEIDVSKVDLTQLNSHLEELAGRLEFSYCCCCHLIVERPYLEWEGLQFGGERCSRRTLSQPRRADDIGAWVAAYARTAASVCRGTHRERVETLRFESVNTA